MLSYTTTSHRILDVRFIISQPRLPVRSGTHTLHTTFFTRRYVNNVFHIAIQRSPDFINRISCETFDFVRSFNKYVARFTVPSTFNITCGNIYVLGIAPNHKSLQILYPFVRNYYRTTWENMFCF